MCCREAFWGHHVSSSATFSLEEMHLCCLSTLSHSHRLWLASHLSFTVSFCCPLHYLPATLLPIYSSSVQPLPFLCTHHVPSALLHLPHRTVIYEKRSLEVPQAIYHLENCSKHKIYFGKLEQGQLDYLVYAQRASYCS